jgi:CSLREA domain-containing protein
VAFNTLSASVLLYDNHRREGRSKLLEQCGNTSRWGIGIGITLLGVFLSASAQAAVFTVNSPFDVSDANPGNRVCETAPGNGVCTLRAAIEVAPKVSPSPGTLMWAAVE